MNRGPLGFRKTPGILSSNIFSCTGNTFRQLYWYTIWNQSPVLGDHTNSHRLSITPGNPPQPVYNLDVEMSTQVQFLLFNSFDLTFQKFPFSRILHCFYSDMIY